MRLPNHIFLRGQATRLWLPNARQGRGGERQGRGGSRGGLPCRGAKCSGLYSCTSAFPSASNRPTRALGSGSRSLALPDCGFLREPTTSDDIRGVTPTVWPDNVYYHGKWSSLRYSALEPTPGCGAPSKLRPSYGPHGGKGRANRDNAAPRHASINCESYHAHTCKLLLTQTCALVSKRWRLQLRPQLLKRQLGSKGTATMQDRSLINNPVTHATVARNPPMQLSHKC